MVMYSEQPGIGTVGGRLLWSDGRLQHVGVGFDNGLPGHTYRGFAGELQRLRQRGADRPQLPRGDRRLPDDPPRRLRTSWAASRRRFRVNFNDVDYCLKAPYRRPRIVYDPDLVLYHFESSSRDPEVEEWELNQLLDRWQQVVAVDPFDNPNLRRGLPRIAGHFLWARRRRPRLRLQRKHLA